MASLTPLLKFVRNYADISYVFVTANMEKAGLETCLPVEEAHQLSPQESE